MTVQFFFFFFFFLIKILLFFPTALFDVMNNETYDIGWGSVFRWVSQYTRAMICLHNFSPQVLHRDFKSLNILVTHDWQCRVCDFGLSRFNTSAALETLKQMRGTLTHMAPEVCPTAVDDGTPASKAGPQFQYTNKSDVYSMGIVLWELLKRCVEGAYRKPWFSEFPALTNPGMEIMIILKAQQGIRPSLEGTNLEAPTPGRAPEAVVELYRQTVAQNREERPSTEQLLERVLALQAAFEADPGHWNACCKSIQSTVPLVPTEVVPQKASEGSSSPVSATTSPAPLAVTPKAATKTTKTT